MNLRRVDTIRLILGDQLNSEHSWFKQVDPHTLYVIAEIRSETDYTLHHIQKICVFFGAMRRFSAYIKAQGHQVYYQKIDEYHRPQSFAGILDDLTTTYKPKNLEAHYPDEYRLLKLLENYRSPFGHKIRFFDSEHFILPFENIGKYFAKNRPQLMERFYRSMRKNTGYLLSSDQKPEGGRWNFDTENRKKIPAHFILPPRYFPHNDLKDEYHNTLQSGCKFFGFIQPDQVIWPIDRDQALVCLESFVQHCLPYFGTYQDAMTHQDPFLMHSRLSFALNSKLISPQEVIEKAIGAYYQHPGTISLPQIEGFVRQILGWREYMRGIYWANMPDYQQLNFFNHQRKLPSWYWTGKTKMNCLATCIEQSLQWAYAHHIQRLMVTGNFALLAGIHPDEVDQWYLGIYIDAIEWVEITNTRGMSQYADGGIVGSKPYVSSANYIQKMSNYCAKCHYNPKKRTGPDACPFNSLYWAFYLQNKSALRSNPRVGMVYRIIDQMPINERIQITQAANRIIDNIENI